MPRSKRRRHQTTGKAHEQKTRPRIGRSLIWKSTALIAILLATSVAFGLIGKWRNENPSARAPGSAPLSTPEYNANTPAKEYMYAGSKLLAVSEPENPPPADLAVWRPSNGTWYVLGGTGSAQVTQTWGITGDTAAPGDFDGDGKTDFCVFREDDPSSNYTTWYIMMSSDGVLLNIQWGLTGDKPVPADYDGDGRSDLAVLRQNDPSSGNTKWYITRSSDSQQTSTAFGLNADKPAPADYDGDGLADLGVWRGSDETLRSITSSNSTSNTIAFDSSNALTLGSANPVSGDYDGDGKADYAVLDSSTSPTTWRIRLSSTSTTANVAFGLSGDEVVQNDYDGDGKCDIAVWRSGTQAYWYILQSTDSEMRTEAWGITGDKPVPAYYRR